MINAYYTTTGAMVAQFNRLDVISNNLANVIQLHLSVIGTNYIETSLKYN